MSDTYDAGEFQERADYIEESDLLKWTVDSAHFRHIQAKLRQRGAKLIVGPRGTGKTHQMRYVYNQCLSTRKYPAAVYVSFSKYYHLEPYLFKAPNAATIFHTWVLCKILLGTHQLVEDMKDHSKSVASIDSLFCRDRLRDFVAKAEKGVLHDDQNELVQSVTIEATLEAIEGVTESLARKRCVLLLDDAALTLTPDYMVEFFDVFRSLNTVRVSPKASVYPGTTEYGPRFHLGQDAEKVDLWLNVEDTGYDAFMDNLVERRLQLAAEQVPSDLLQLFKFAAFGVPRAFIALLRAFSQTPGRTVQKRFNSVVGEQADLIKNEYLSIKTKLPQYKTVIETGYALFEKAVELLVEENRRDKTHKQLQIGIAREETVDVRLQRMMKFLVEAGLLHPLSAVKHGPEREYDRYVPHLLFLIQKRAFIKSRGFDAPGVLERLNSKPQKHPVRRTMTTLLQAEELAGLKLDLPPCRKCNAPRLTDEQKFCHQCGSELVGYSAFEACMDITVDELPITAYQKKKVTAQTRLRTIRDFLSVADPGTELRKADYIGRKRSEQIHRKVMLIVEEFLA